MDRETGGLLFLFWFLVALAGVALCFLSCAARLRVAATGSRNIFLGSFIVMGAWAHFHSD